MVLMKFRRALTKRSPRAFWRALAKLTPVADAAVPIFPPIPLDTLRNAGYTSQLGQDFLVDQVFFRGVPPGVFVEVGAHDGIHFSNTYFLETVRGWTGLCVEPNPAFTETLRENRKCAVATVAVGSEAGLVDFSSVKGPSGLSGVSAHFNRRHQKRINKEVRASFGRIDRVPVPQKTLQSVLDEHQISRIDVLTVDTEGSELRVLEGIDFGRTCISMIFVERNYSSQGVVRLLKRVGFLRVLALGFDDLYLRRDLIPGDGALEME